MSTTLGDTLTADEAQATTDMATLITAVTAATTAMTAAAAVITAFSSAQLGQPVTQPMIDAVKGLDSESQNALPALNTAVAALNAAAATAPPVPPAA